jgi:peptidoglycan/xylan/chitin deacetylase (PgdA/CDA1 family)
LTDIETNRAKIVRRLEQEGWELARHGSEHHRRAAPSHALARRCSQDRKDRRLALSGLNDKD